MNKIAEKLIADAQNHQNNMKAKMQEHQSLEEIANSMFSNIDKPKKKKDKDAPSLAEQLSSQTINSQLENKETIEDILSSSSLDELTVSQIDSLIERLKTNDDFDSFLLDLPKYKEGGKKMTKEDKVSMIMDIRRANNIGLDGVVTLSERTHEYKVLSLSEVMIHPHNCRNELDYIDPDLLKSIRMAGSSIKDIVLSGEQMPDEDGVMKYPAIAGNRNLFQHFEIARQDGISFDDYKLSFKVVNYSGSSKLNELQTLRDIIADNNASLQPSTLDRVRHGVQLLSAMTQQNAAKEVGLSYQTFSQYKKYLDLPPEIQRLIDAHDKRHHFARTLDQKQLQEYGLRYRATHEGIEVCGLTSATTDLLCKILNQTDPALREEALGFVLSKETLDRACFDSHSEFKAWLRKNPEAVKFNVVRQSKASLEVTSSVDTSGNKVIESKVDGKTVSTSMFDEKKPKTKRSSEPKEDKKFPTAQEVEEAERKYRERSLAKFAKDTDMKWEDFRTNFTDGEWKFQGSPMSLLMEILNGPDKNDSEVMEMMSLLIQYTVIIPRQ